MVILTTKNETKEFNLKNYDREKALYNAWYAMHNDEKFMNKTIKITTTANETFQIKISDILDCKFEEAVYFNANGKVENGKTKKSNSRTSVH